MKLQHPALATFEFEPEYGVLSGHVDLAGATIPVEIESENALPAEQETVVGRLMERVAALDRLARAAILDAPNSDADEDPVTFYAAHHIQELEPEDLRALFDTDAPTVAAFLAKLSLRSLCIYPDEDDDAFAVFDYTISEELTQYVLAVGFDRGGNALSIDMES